MKGNVTPVDPGWIWRGSVLDSANPFINLLIQERFLATLITCGVATRSIVKRSAVRRIARWYAARHLAVRQGPSRLAKFFAVVRLNAAAELRSRVGRQAVSCVIRARRRADMPK